MITAFEPGLSIYFAATGADAAQAATLCTVQTPTAPPPNESKIQRHIKIKIKGGGELGRRLPAGHCAAFALAVIRVAIAAHPAFGYRTTLSARSFRRVSPFLNGLRTIAQIPPFTYSGESDQGVERRE
jgi:hypothetical protein